MKSLLLVIILICQMSILNAQWIRQVDSSVKNDLNNVKFISNKVGWIVGYEILLKTIDGGMTWSSIPGTEPFLSYDIAFIDSLNGIIVTWEGYYLTTSDGGLTWKSYLLDRSMGLISVAISNNKTVTIVGATGDGYHGRIYSKKVGDTVWTTIETNFGMHCVSFSDGNNGRIVGFNGLNFRTTDGGIHWNEQPLISSDGLYSLYSVSFYDVNNGIVVGEDCIICKTTNGGISWSKQYGGYYRLYIGQYLRSVCFKDSENITAVGTSGTILRSTDSGTTWILQSSGTYNGLYSVFFTSIKNGIVVGDGGIILRTSNGGITFSAEEKNNNILNNYILAQNYPNPFNPITTIRYSLAKQGKIELKIFDLLGRELKTLINSYKPAGIYEIIFDASNLSSGVYYYRIQTGEFINTKQLIVLK